MEGGPAEHAESTSDGDVGIDLYWIHLGAGASVVKLNGKAHEAIKAFIEHRSRAALYHSALAIHAPEGRYVVEVTPVRIRTEANGVSSVRVRSVCDGLDGSACSAMRSAGG
jgi:hypothetical protein